MRATQVDATGSSIWNGILSSFRTFARFHLGGPHLRAMTDLLFIQLVVSSKWEETDMRFCLCAALVAALSAVAALAADKPQYGTWGFDSSGMDAKTKPGDDFFRYTNGAWLDRTKIPPDKPAFSLRILMTVKIEERLHDMMGKAARKNETSDIEGKVGAFYKAFMDEKQIESRGAKPIAPEPDAVRAAKARDDRAGLMVKSPIDL